MSYNTKNIANRLLLILKNIPSPRTLRLSWTSQDQQQLNYIYIYELSEVGHLYLVGTWNCYFGSRILIGIISRKIGLKSLLYIYIVRIWMATLGRGWNITFWTHVIFCTVCGLIWGGKYGGLSELRRGGRSK